MATQTVTVLFTDLVGSTALSSRLAPDEAESLRLTHFGLLRGAIDAAGGTEVKNLGDGLMVAFTSLSRALACAVAMQQAIERHNQRGDGEELSVRIGISTGETTEEDGDYFGEPVIEAARLCAAAAGGQILATEIVKLVAGRQATQEFVSVGDLELKGLPEPVAAVEVVWEPAAAAGEAGDQIPLPVRLVGASAESLFAFFGRAPELRRLAEARKATVAERSLRVSLVSGEPGIGKTTLVAQAARTAHADGANVLYGSCEEGLTIPYQPWIAALTQLVEHTDEPLLRDFVDTHGPATMRLVPALARRLSTPVPPPSSDADAEQFLILEGVARLLALASTEAPAVVVLDDLHWADAASVQLLRHLVTATVPMAVHVVGTYRESDLSRTHPLVGALAELRRETSVDRVELTGLDDVEIVDLLGAAAGHDVADDGVALAHALRRETGGNPFFLVEVIRHLAETGAFTQDHAGRWVVAGDLDDLGLPSSVREVVAHRVARLGPDTEKALSLAAVIGRDFDLDLLAGLVDQDEDGLLDLLDSAIAAGLVTEPEHQFGRYRFVHALIQHTLYQELSAGRRQRTHQRVAEALEAQPATADGQPVAELAHHWLAATRPSDAAKALYYATKAGDAALAAFAPEDAIEWYTQALDLLDRQGGGDDHARCRLLVGLGTAQCRAARSEFRDSLREAGSIARRLGDRDLLVAVARSRDPGIEMMAEVDADRLALLEAALEAVGPSDSADRAHLLAGLAEEMDPRDPDRAAVALDAVDLAHRLGDERAFLDVLLLASSPMTTPDSLDLRRGETTRAIEVAERLGDPASLSAVLGFRMMVAGEAGDLAEFDVRLAQVASIVERYGSPVVRYQHLMFRSWRHLVAGRLEAATVDADAALELGTRMGMGHASSTYGSQLLQRAFQQGSLDELVVLIEQTVADVPTIPAWRAALMYIYNELGRYDEATALFDVGIAASFDDVPFDLTWLPTMGNYAECAADTRRVDAAPLLYERLLPYVDRMLFAASLDWGLVSRVLGRLATLLGRYDDAEELLRQTQARNEAMAAPYWIARTRLDQAELALARRAPGDDAAADALIRDALATADEYGYGGLLPRAERLRTSR